MHEIGALHQAVKLVDKVARENQVDKVTYITLEIGELTGFLPVFFEKYFSVVAEEFPIVKDTELRMSIVRGQAVCSECDTLYNVMRCEGACPKCGSREKKILGGTEFKVKDIGFI